MNPPRPTPTTDADLADLAAALSKVFALLQKGIPDIGDLMDTMPIVHQDKRRVAENMENLERLTIRMQDYTAEESSSDEDVEEWDELDREDDLHDKGFRKMIHGVRQRAEEKAVENEWGAKEWRCMFGMCLQDAWRATRQEYEGARTRGDYKSLVMWMGSRLLSMGFFEGFDKTEALLSGPAGETERGRFVKNMSELMSDRPRATMITQEILQMLDEDEDEDVDDEDEEDEEEWEDEDVDTDEDEDEDEDMDMDVDEDEDEDEDEDTDASESDEESSSESDEESSISVGIKRDQLQNARTKAQNKDRRAAGRVAC